MRIRNFKSWADTGEMRLAPITGLFGTNSSGKTSIIQALLLLKQTAESTDRAQVLNLGGSHALVEFGTLPDILHQHSVASFLDLAVGWQPERPVSPVDPEHAGRNLFSASDLRFETTVRAIEGGGGYESRTVSFVYTLSSDTGESDPVELGMKPGPTIGHEIYAVGFEPKRAVGRPWPLPPPTKCYRFPDQVFGYFQNTGFLADVQFAFEEMLAGVFYLGPLREYPRREYSWAGSRPSDMGKRGESAVDALLASRTRDDRISRGKGHPRVSLEERVAIWLRDLGLIDSFRVQPVAEGSTLYQVLVRRHRLAAEVPVTDVGFGVSQILPVLTLCYYAPRGSTIVLEQPEIHLHPSVQAGLADVIIDAVKHRGVQIMVESHSEHLLRRLQRRMAEEAITPDDTALYFCESGKDGASKIRALELDLFGNISNWPDDFFGNEIGELASTVRARMARQARKVS